ncbi:hypothetical protein HY489_02485 [Candidatus Woesearchaeota archaeon]|nr:hypothetical protein [Candidatus Woesearchaeota archaeon]
MKEVLRNKVPESVQKLPEFSVFLKWCSDEKISSVDQLKQVFKAEMVETQKKLDALKSGREGTNNRAMRPLAKHLDFMKFMQEKIVNEL